MMQNSCVNLVMDHWFNIEDVGVICATDNLAAVTRSLLKVDRIIH